MTDADTLAAVRDLVAAGHPLAALRAAVERLDTEGKRQTCARCGHGAVTNINGWWLCPVHLNLRLVMQ